MCAHTNISLFIDKSLLVLFFLVIVINIDSLFFINPKIFCSTLFSKMKIEKNCTAAVKTAGFFPKNSSFHHLFPLKIFL